MRRLGLFRTSLLLVIVACARPPEARPSSEQKPVDALPTCDRTYDGASYDSTLQGLRCPSPNARDGCGGLAGTCGDLRVLEDDSGLVGTVRYYDSSGKCVATKTVYYEHPGTPPTIEGTIPSCKIQGLVPTCARVSR